MKKIKLTPLNIITALSLTLGVVVLFQKQVMINPVEQSMKGLWIAICLLAAVISFLSDQIFRKFIPLLRNIWVIECAFIVFTIVLVFLFKTALT